MVEAIVQALLPLCEKLAVERPPRARRFGDLLHLETSFAGDLKPADDGQNHLLRLIARLHPTPAVGGAPRQRACQWIGAREGLDRGWFAAPIGWFDRRGDGHFVVALRSALIRRDRAWALAGAGINALSEPAAEWQETEAKLGTIAGALCCKEAARSNR